MRILLALLLMLLSAVATAEPADDLESALSFFTWLEGHAHGFGRCEPRKDDAQYVLCDGTRVDAAVLKSLFAKSPQELEEWIRSQGLKIEVLCDGKAAGAFVTDCATTSTRKAFQSITALHGQYLPDEKTILVRGSATAGSLVHEYLHSLEAANTNAIYGKVYKRDRLAVQKGLRDAMDAEIVAVQALESKGRKADAAVHTKSFLAASELLAHFGLWQDLIDERSLFLLYLKFGKEFGAADADLALAKKNMAFICARKELKPVLPKAECR